ncbi:retrovirus-related pol polyprotein from transposon TNT 1-94, partial [Tanacetum coccineum]
LRDENVSIKKHYQDLYKSKAESNSNVSSRAAVPEKPKVLAPGLYAMTPKYIPPHKRNNREANAPLPRKEAVSLVKKTNVYSLESVTEASKSKSKCETKTHRNLPARSENVKRVDNPLRNLNKRNHVDSSLSVKRTGFTSQFVSVCKTSTGKIFASVGSKWKPTGRKFTLGDTCPLTRITKPEVVPLEKSGSVSTSEPANNVIVTPRFSKKPLTSYKRKDRKLKDISTGSPPNTETKAVNDPVNVVQIILWYLDSGCSRHMTGDRSKLINYVEKFIGTVRFGNDQFAAIVGYGDYKFGDTIITRVYYVEGLSHNLFSVGQFCDAGLEVAFRKYTCYIRNKDKVDLLKGSRTTNLYSISLKDMMEASPVFLLSKASLTKSWLWHRRLNHLNFGTLNKLAQKDLVRGLPKLKYEKEHLCPSCQLGKSKKSSHPLKTVNTNIEVLNTLHIDLCGPMRVESINGKKYIVVIVGDYTRFDNRTEFVNKTLIEFCESVGITHNTSVPQTPQQNGIVETQNRTLMEAARTMLIFAKATMFLWAELVATACYTLNRSLVHTLHGKTYYELLKGKKPEVKYFWVFRSLCYPTNDYDDLGKLKAKADIGMTFVQPSTRLGPNSIAPGHNSAGPEINNLQSGRIGSGLVATPTTPILVFFVESCFIDFALNRASVHRGELVIILFSSRRFDKVRDKFHVLRKRLVKSRERELHTTTTSITSYPLKIQQNLSHFIFHNYSFIMSTPVNTSSTDSQMHNNIMAAGSKERPPMLGPGRYSQWRSRFLRYIDTKSNVHNMSQEKKLYFKAEKDAIFLLLTGIGDEIYSTVDACNTANEIWTAIERLQQGESLNIQDVKTNLFWEFGKFTSRDEELISVKYTYPLIL